MTVARSSILLFPLSAVRVLSGCGGWLVYVGAVELPESAYSRFKILQAIEALVHAGEPEVRDHIEVLQRAEDGKTDVMCVDLGEARRADLLLDVLR